jgi:hypothetical protein
MSRMIGDSFIIIVCGSPNRRKAKRKSQITTTQASINFNLRLRLNKQSLLEILSLQRKSYIHKKALPIKAGLKKRLKIK